MYSRRRKYLMAVLTFDHLFWMGFVFNFWSVSPFRLPVVTCSSKHTGKFVSSITSKIARKTSAAKLASIGLSVKLSLVPRLRKFANERFCPSECFFLARIFLLFTFSLALSFVFALAKKKADFVISCCRFYLFDRCIVLRLWLVIAKVHRTWRTLWKVQTVPTIVFGRCSRSAFRFDDLNFLARPDFIRPTHEMLTILAPASYHLVYFRVSIFRCQHNEGSRFWCRYPERE